MAELAEWDSFYVIIGSAAGTLIGLQFVVMTLIAARPPIRAAEAGPVFATPTIVHFSIALLLSALLRAAWHGLAPALVLSGLIGLGGFVYMTIVGIRIRQQTAYGPDVEDWLFHLLLPLVGYLVLGLSALAGLLSVRGALFGIAATVLLLVFIGIHNTWDSVSYVVFAGNAGADQKRSDDEKSDGN